MYASTVRNLFSPATWRGLWKKLGDLEVAMATTEGDIHERRMSRIEAEIDLLRGHVGLPSGVTFKLPSAAATFVGPTVSGHPHQHS